MLLRPNIIALNPLSVFSQSLVYLFVLQFLSIIALLAFRYAVDSAHRTTLPEGHAPAKWTAWGRLRRALVMIVGFLLVVFWLPVSTVCLKVLVWSDDLWAVENPYKLTDDPSFPPRGAGSGLRDPSDFCLYVEGAFHFA